MPQNLTNNNHAARPTWKHNRFRNIGRQKVRVSQRIQAMPNYHMSSVKT